MKLSRSTPIAFLILIPLLGTQGPSPDSDDPFDPEAILATARFLSSDALAGRAAGTSEGNIAALYIASRFEALGLEPLGVEDTYLQGFGKGRNVLARLPGSDPEKALEAILIGAHFDHLGRKGEEIYNGADDNASGTAVLLAIAGALSRGDRPRRSIVFAAFDGEEQGLLGSRHYLEHPAVPIGKTVLMINLDMVGRDFFDFFPKFLFVVGSELSKGLRDVVREGQDEASAFRLLWFSVSLLDRFWASSDHLPFWEADVPILFFSTSMHRDYHKPSDDVERLKPEKMARIGRLVASTIRRVANADERPPLEKNDEIITEEDRKAIEALIKPGIAMGPMLGLGPDVIERLREIQSDLGDDEKDWEEPEVDALCKELRDLLAKAGGS